MQEEVIELPKGLQTLGVGSYPPLQTALVPDPANVLVKNCHALA